jgi:hypothetical protein
MSEGGEMPAARTLGLGRVLVVWLAGLAAGVQIALYLFDLYDDGVADWRSGAIGLALAAAGLAFVGWTFRPPRAAPGAVDPPATPVA